ncbi:MAG: DNA methyltransferase [Nocardioidaceae bacterium]
MNPAYTRDRVTLHQGDCLDVLADLPDASIDAVVTDPPYSYAFMGRAWDSHESPKAYESWCYVWALLCHRVLKPGGHVLAFGGTRTFHRLACGIEDAGFQIRDTVADLTGYDAATLLWVYGSGFPKSLDVSKAIDKARDDRDAIRRVTAYIATARATAGLTNRDIDAVFGFNGMAGHWTTQGPQAAVPTWDQWLQLRTLLGFGDDMDAEVWRLNGRKGSPGEAWEQREVIGERTTGLGTGRGTVAYIADSDNRDITAPATDAAKQWQGFGTALKPAHEPVICARKPLAGTVAANVQEYRTGALNIDSCRVGTDGGTRSTGAPNRLNQVYGDGMGGLPAEPLGAGRWPTNLVLGEPAAAELDEQSGEVGGGPGRSTRGGGSEGAWNPTDRADKAGQTVRGDGREIGYRDSGGASRFFPVFRYEPKADTDERVTTDGITHPTVKPLALMRWLVRLVTPPGGTVLDPFTGTGTTLEAALLEGFHAIGIERDPSYVRLAAARLNRRLDPTAYHHATRGSDDTPSLLDLIAEETA